MEKEKEKEKIFAIMSYPNDANKRKLLYKYTINETKTFFEKNSQTPNGLGCINYENNQIPFQNTVLYYPEEKGGKYILGQKTLDEICKDNKNNLLIQFLDNVISQYHSSRADKTEFLRDYNAIKFIPIMTEDEAIKYIENLPNINLEEWIGNLPDSLYISNYSLRLPSPPLEIQTKIFNELLSHFFTAEFVYAIYDDLYDITATEQ
jgi:hypothetical protein